MPFRLWRRSATRWRPGKGSRSGAKVVHSSFASEAALGALLSTDIPAPAKRTTFPSSILSKSLSKCSDSSLVRWLRESVIFTMSLPIYGSRNALILSGIGIRTRHSMQKIEAMPYQDFGVLPIPRSLCSFFYSSRRLSPIPRHSAYLCSIPLHVIRFPVRQSGEPHGDIHPGDAHSRIPIASTTCLRRRQRKSADVGDSRRS